MLVLTRKLGESIAIDDHIKIRVVQIKGKQVRLGIKADPTTIVHREEIYQRIQEENRQAAAAQTSQVDTVREMLGSDKNAMGRAPLRRTVRPNRPKDEG